MTDDVQNVPINSLADLKSAGKTHILEKATASGLVTILDKDGKVKGKLKIVSLETQEPNDNGN